MRRNKHLMCGCLLCICLLFTGCGTQLYELTEAEEDAIVLYSAKMISKYNRAQNTGYCFVLEEEEDENTSDSSDDASEDNTSQEEEQQQDGVASFEDIIGIEGLQFAYQGYEISNSYTTQDIAVPDAEEGMSYLILNIQASNVLEEDMAVDLLTDPIKYAISINEGEAIECMSTLSMEDLSTYYNSSLKAQSTDDTVLLFKVKTENTTDISAMTLEVKKGEQTFRVKIL